jgi:hypothetical protein
MINHEIVKGWDDGKGVVGIYVHNLLHSDKTQCGKGVNPFSKIGYGNTGKMLSSIVKAYDPPYTKSTDVYDHISRIEILHCGSTRRSRSGITTSGFAWTG